MDLIAPGMHVDIKRSDGRVHTAVVTETRRDRNAVMVEWFEKGETKGKEIDLDQLMAINPTLRRRPPPVQLDEILLDNDENEETLDDIELPKRLTAFNNKTSSEKRKTMLFDDPPQSTPAATRTAPLPDTSRCLAPPRRSMIVAPTSLRTPAPSKEATPTTPSVPAPAALSNTIMSRSSEKADLDNSRITKPTDKSATVQNIEKLQKERDERRAQQEQARKAREVEKSIDPGNPNYQFLLMIREYQANVDYRPLKMSDPVTDARISVCVRKRPFNKREINKREIEVVTIPNRDHLVLHQPMTKVDLTKYLENQKFRFDYTFDENSSNEMVYRFTAQPLVKTIFQQGFATCFAYGQTGSGKTHTMGGDFNGRVQDASAGIYALTAADVFRLRDKEYAKHKLTVVCSFFEIYGSKVFDLLNGKAMLRVLEDAKKEVNIVGLKEEVVENETDVLRLIKTGTDVRTAGSTSANSNSSRSHAVFQIILRKAKKTWGKFSLIDLAGNERGQDNGSSDHQTRMEGAEINKSLLALKECIRAMGKNSSHVPFRSSKLTMVLRDSFIGENARTCMIAMIGPGHSSCEHTLNTLRYADRVKELGADEGGSAQPLADNELMLPPTNSDDEEDQDLSLICVENGADPVEFRLLAQIAAKEEETLAKQMEIPSMLRKAAEQMEQLLKRSNKPDYDQRNYSKDLVACCKKIVDNSKGIIDSAERWLELIEKEAELATKTNGRCK